MKVLTVELVESNRRERVSGGVYIQFESDVITERNLRQNGKQCWFNITNVKNEINEYAKQIGVKSDIGELIICIEKDGLSYHDKEQTIQKLIDTERTNRITLIN